ncbi:hypothetical protein [Acidiferrobacter sp.]|uniref:beta strand repeat-containing protein n=1 Tax=Acidiferrobacter sp. TaxID=1872107 RepID=UPI002636ED8B|nr:hypothetical protein [Acidiferrobacter sp.]
MATQWKFRTIVAAVGMALIAPVAMAKTTGQAQATANSSQVAAGSFDFAVGSTNSATINKHVLQNAKGNIGVNIAAGAGNMQVNNTDIALANGALTKKTSTSSLVENTQWSNIFSLSLSADVTNNASASNHVLQNASGNIGLNVAAGADNMQANNTALSHALGVLPSGQASSTIESSQFSGPWALALAGDNNDTAALSNHVLQNASGNIGANIAAGDGNMQANGLAVSYNRGGLDAYAGAGSYQGAMLVGALAMGADNDATLSNHVLQNASGNIGVNVAAGEQNMQENGLSIATAKAVYPYSPTTATGSSMAQIANGQSSLVAGSLTMGSDNDAGLSNHVLQNASGNIGANVAAGEQNMQENGLSIATAKAVYPYSPTTTTGSSIAQVANSQNGGFIAGSLTIGSDNDAGLSNHVLQNATGNIGVNAAAGTQNMQANNTAVALDWSTRSGGVADSSIANNQNAGPMGGSFSLYGDDDASITNHVLQHASGNVNVNVASGADNMQENGLASTFNNAGAVATAAIDNDQGTEGYYGNSGRWSWSGGSADHAYLSGHALQDTSGNVGANVAAGEWNEQANNLSIAYAAGPVGSTTTATAAISDNQASNMAFYWPSIAVDRMGAMTASLSDKVLQNATGNVGVNVASGLQNVQANNTALAQGWGTGNGDMDADNTGGPATAMITGTQRSGPYSFAADRGATNSASVANHVLQNASGNIGANVAAGLQNMQSNDLAYAFNQAGSNAVAVSQVSQVSMGAIAADTPVSFCYTHLPTINTASVSNHVMQNATGNVGLNVAAGAANMQRNTLTIADAD